MKRTYLTPEIHVVDVHVEKGFAVSPSADSFGIENFGYAIDGDDTENTAW